jgi:hypothetical protein
MDSVEAATFVRPGSPPITQITFLACHAQYPGGPNRCLSVSSLFARPSPVNRRVGVHDFTFEACSSFTHVTACKIAGPPKGGRLSRGFGPASYPTAPLGSYHVSPTTTWMDPPSISDLRPWGALLTEGDNRASNNYSAEPKTLVADISLSFSKMRLSSRQRPFEFAYPSHFVVAMPTSRYLRQLIGRLRPIFTATPCGGEKRFFGPTECSFVDVR